MVVAQAHRASSVALGRNVSRANCPDHRTATMHDP